MEIGSLTLIIVVVFLAALALGLPIAFSLSGVAILFILILLGPMGLYLVFSAAYSTMTKDVYLALPLFVFMAAILHFSGLGTALYTAMHSWLGALKGGLAIGTVAACAIIAAMTGMTATGVLTMGIIALPEMLKHGYDKKLAMGTVMSAGPLGILIPPSIGFVVIGGLASLSVGKLFMSGVLPGVLVASLFCIYIGVRSAIQPHLAPALPHEQRPDLGTKIASLRYVILPALVIIAMLGGIYSGAATPTEAAAVGALLCLVSSIIYRQFTWKNLREAVFMTVKINGLVMWLLIGGVCFSSLLGIVGVSRWMSDFFLGLPVKPVVIIIIMQVIIFIGGMLIEAGALTIILIPIFMPIVEHLGYDPIWFSCLFMVQTILANITPPVGYSLFYMKGLLPDTSMEEIYRSVPPFIAVDAIAVALLIVFPSIATWLPSKMG